MENILFTGVCTALVTPFLDGSVNYPLLNRLLQRQLDAGISSLVLCGTTGEAPALSDDEKLSIFQKAKDYVGDRCQIIAGTGSNNTSHAMELSIQAEKAGADALLIVSPYYNKATPSGVLSHYRTICEAVKIPIILYNVPSRTGFDMPIDVYQELAELPNIAGVKEASADITKILRIREKCPRSFAVWCGNDDMTVPVIALGGKGVISVASNADPVRMQIMTQAALDGDFDTAASMQICLAPFTRLLSRQVNPVPIKEAMRLTGFDCGCCRLPLGNAEIETTKELHKYLNAYPPLDGFCLPM